MQKIGWNKRVLCVLGLALLCAQLIAAPAMALREPRPLGLDSRVHIIMYAEDEVYKFTGHYGFQSSIVFAPDEEIQTISMGDSIPWMINPSGNRIFLKPIEAAAQTNMTVLTNKRTYLFELHAEEAESISDPAIAFILRFVYPTEMSAPQAVEEVRTPEDDGYENFNFQYTVRGSDEILPIKIYDDGEFTYFEFRDKNAEIPAFYVVDAYGKEALINFRTRGDYIVVERVATRFTLRNGTMVGCVYNEARPFAHEMMRQAQQQ